jgi:hypothetical protein
MSTAKKKTGKQVVLPPTKPLDVKATGKQIGQLVAAADKAAAAYNDAATPLQALLIDLAQNHPKQLREVLKHTGLGRSRTAELLAVAEGRTTLKEIRAANAERQQRSRAAKKVKALSAPKSVTVTDEPAGNGGNSEDPDASAGAMKASHADAEDDDADTEAEADTETEGEPEATEAAEEEPAAEETADEKPAEETEPVAKAARSRSAKPKPPVDVSKKALAELRVAVDTWLPRITDADDRQAALNYVTNAVLLMGTKTEVAA